MITCNSNILDRDFFAQHTLAVAQQLLGKRLVFQGKSGLIVETEAYRGSDDPASHAYRGITPRTRIMFDHPGFSYVYLIYGLHYCLNFVTEPKGNPGAVLIRGIVCEDTHQTISGPARVCRYFGITTEHNGIDLIQTQAFCVQNTAHTPSFVQTPRIGIRKGCEAQWRFVGSLS